MRPDAIARFFDGLRDGAWAGRIAEGRTTTVAVNPSLRALLGYPADAADEDVRPFDAERFADPASRDVFLQQLAARGGVDDFHLRLLRLDGTSVWVDVTASAARVSGTSSALEAQALVRDVSERRHRDDQARDLYHQLIQAEKMAALGQTISGVAHELNNPLATILSWAERLQERPGDEKTRRGLDVILAEAERAARIVRHLLTFARKRQTTRMMIDLNQIIAETLALRAYEHKVTNLSVSQELAPGLPQVFADGHQLKQVLLNLIINAEQAMLTANGRGHLRVRTSRDAARNVLTVEVADDGPGIPDEVQAKMFDPFFTTKEVGKGTGLGLTVAYAIVQEHGGRIWAQSSRGTGTSFFVELPAAGTNPSPKAPSTQVVSTDAFRGRKVLVVEDEPALATAVAEALGDAGFDVERAGDGEEGLTKLAQGAFDLIVCDLKMPRIDGRQFYRAIAAATPALARRVIFVTGDVAGTDAERFLEETGCRWLSKPFRLAELLRAARDTLA
ncbi:MAG: ATP-binding protein [Acidobacteriota bacterium]